MDKRFIVVNHEHMNTGGNITVSIFTVYDTTENTTRFVIANENGFSWQTADTVSNSDFTLDSDEMIEKIVLGSWDWDALVTDPSYDMHMFTDDEFELFKYCQFEFYKKDCQYFDFKYGVSLNQLPQELYSRLTQDYIRWANETDSGCLTDGYDVYPYAEYEPSPSSEDAILKGVNDFKDWLESLKYSPSTIDAQFIEVALADRTVKIPFHADSYELLERFMKGIIDNW